MIEKLKDGEFRESVISAKLNELIDVFNNHYGTQYYDALDDKVNGPDPSSSREESDESLSGN